MGSVVYLSNAVHFLKMQLSRLSEEVANLRNGKINGQDFFTATTEPSQVPSSSSPLEKEITVLNNVVSELMSGTNTIASDVFTVQVAIEKLKAEQEKMIQEVTESLKKDILELREELEKIKMVSTSKTELEVVRTDIDKHMVDSLQTLRMEMETLCSANKSLPMVDEDIASASANASTSPSIDTLTKSKKSKVVNLE
jgi:FtsZ-binding cell division protein ZapB